MTNSVDADQTAPDLCTTMFASKHVLSSFESSRRGRESWLLCFYCLIRMPCYCKFSVTLPRGAVGLSAVCDCGIA